MNSAEQTPAVICIPVHPAGGKFKDNTELRYTLRSIARHFQGPYRVVIIGPKRPAWIHGAEFLQQTKGALKTALVMAADAFPAGFFWWYDDCCLLADQSAADLRVTTARSSFGSVQTTWGRWLDQIRQRLHADGIPAVDYSRPHGPYWFDKPMIDEAFADWPKMKGKFPFETWILSKRRWPSRVGCEVQYYGDFRTPPGPHHILLNWCDAGFTNALRAWLDTRFPTPGPFETPPPALMEIHTLRYGDSWWLRHCGDSLDAWAAKHGHPVRIWTAADAPADYPNPKFLEVDMLRAFLRGGSQWLLYVDADVWVDSRAPATPDLSLPGFHIMPDMPLRHTRTWKTWVEKNFGKDAAQDVEGWNYRNAGVWLCDRESASAMLEAITGPYVQAMMEQHQWNFWLARAVRHNRMPCHELPADWNSFASRKAPAYFQHLAGKQKARKWEELKSLHLVSENTFSNPCIPHPMIPKIIHTCWLSGDPLPDLQEKCLASWRQHCPDYEIKIWDQKNWDSSHWLFARQAIENNQWAFASDVCRLDVLTRFGGIYLDFDVSIKKSFDPLLGHEFFTGTERSKTVGLITPYIMGCVPGNKLVSYFLSHYESNRSFIMGCGNFDRIPNTQIILRQMNALGVDCNGSDNAAIANRVGHVRYPSHILGYDSPHSYAVHHFETHWKKQPSAPREKVFRDIYQNTEWGDIKSGPGSTVEATNKYRKFIRDYISQNNIKSVIDLGCGDWVFSSIVDWSGVEYIGAEIVPDLVDHHNRVYGKSNIRFVKMDVVEDEIPPADLVILKDVLQHLSNQSASRVIHKLRNHNHVLIVQDSQSGGNPDIADGGYRAMNLSTNPFNLEVVKLDGIFPQIPRVHLQKQINIWRPIAQSQGSDASGAHSP